MSTIYQSSSLSDVIQITSLTHRYGPRVALDNLTLSIHPNEIFGLLGPNGSGKTTLFRILCTLIRAAPDTVQMLGQDINHHRDILRRQIGAVFQSPSLDKQLTAEENLRCHGHLYGLSGAELQSRMDELLEKLGISDRRREIVASFSGGMRRRVELAKGLLNRPRILLLDEPSTGLDPAARIDLWKILTDIQSTGKTTILLTTHLMDEADRCTRLAILDQGRLIACDEPSAMKDRIGGDVITLTCPDPETAKTAAAAIQVQFALKVEQLDHSLRIEYAGGHQLIPQLIEALPGLFNSVSVAKPTLEDVFIRVTGHKFIDEERPKSKSGR